MKKRHPFKTLLVILAFIGLLTGPAIYEMYTRKAAINVNPPLQNTTLMVTNTSVDTVQVWLTLSIYTDSLSNYFVQNVNAIYGIIDSGAAGSFNLAPGDTLSYTSPLALSGNLCFGGQAVNCPTTQFPYATNIFEFCLNNNFGIAPQESVEISCIAGVNSFLIGNLKGPNWIVTTGIDTVRVFKNGTIGNNSGRYGVFPTGCTNCTNTAGAPTCTPSVLMDIPNDNTICIIQRPAAQIGGTVICTFAGFTPLICK
jgi:hypothetical protein